MDGDTNIAVVGIGCIFPGANNTEEFWRVLVNGEDHVQNIPPERFNVDAFYDPDPDSPRKTYVRKAGLVKSFDEWDNKFFGISDKEAELVDPQQHFVLETVHMALEDGGITRERLNGSETGVYIGAMNHDWDCLLRSAKQNSTNTTVTGADSSILSARIAYFYNLLGPAMTIETACSSSMVAIHTASQALRNGEISMAIAGGVSFILDPESFINLSSARMASPTGKCHTFSKDADGYARGEGCGIVILKRLADAIRDKNKIWGTIFTWLNQDGHLSSPITSPSGEQQEKLVETIYRKSNIPPSSVQYIEAHGTGTSVGDFTEVNALGSFFSKHASREIPIGSVKTNIGHLESGAGAAALIKVLLMMQKGLFVPSIHAESLNPKIPFKECKLRVCQSVKKWSQNEKGDRIASLNCFGFGGTNSHAVITGYDRRNEMITKDMKTCLSLKKYIILSAEDLIALYNSAKHLMVSLQNEITLADLSSTTVHFRSHYKFRKVFVVEQMSELVAEIDHFVKEELPVKVIGKEKPKIIFVYCGVGTTWRKMCKEFITKDDVFMRTIQDIDNSLRSLTSVSVQSLFENEEDISDPLENHLAIFACQIALTEVWKHVGICPNTIVGQSVGEVAAAYASGTLSLKDAVRVIYFRSLNVAKESAGKMIVIQNCPIEVIEEKCFKLKYGKANIAVYHSYNSCAVSGDKAAIEELKTGLASQNAKIIPLNVKCAYHSHLTKDASLKLEETLTGLEWKNPKTTVISTVSGSVADTTFGSPSYWAANVFKPVLFRHAIQEAKTMNSNAFFLEIGPSPVLRAHLSSIFPDSVEESLPSMKRNYEIDIFRKSFIDIYGKGIPVTWEHIVPCTSNILSIPKYQFNKRKHLVKSERIRSLLSGEEDNKNNMLISRIPGSSEQFNIVISQENTPFIYEHIVDGSTVVPGALYGEIGLEIGHYLVPKSGFTELEVSWSINRALLVKDSEQSLVVKARQEGNQVIHFEAYSSGNKSALTSGMVILARTPRVPVIDAQRLISLLSTETESHIVYMTLQRLGFQHGPIYQTIKKCVIRDKETVCEIRLSNEVMKQIPRTCMHPVILDTMFQSCFGINLSDGKGQKTRILPIRVSHLVVRQRPSQCMICYTTLVYDNATNASFNILLLQKSGSIVAEMLNFEVEKINSPDDIHSLSYQETWKPVKLPETTAPEKAIFVLSWNTEHLSLLENTFRKEFGNIDICSLHLAKTSDNEFSTLQKKAEMQNISVIFAPGLPGIDDNTTGRWLNDTVRKTSQVFLQLLKSIYKMKSHILVITNETQPCISLGTCVIGAELWGMVRAVSHEGTELSFTLLDVDRLNEFSLLNISRIFTGLDAGNRQVPSEYAIRGNVIYTNEITKLSENFHARLYKQCFQEASHPVCIRQKCESDKSPFFAIPCSVESTNPHAICVKPSQALVCKEDTYFIYNNNFPELYCSNANINGEKISVCELVGFAKLGNKDVEIIACCQMELQTEMVIEKHCVFAKSGFNGYRLGDMHAVIIALSIADLVEKKSNVFIDFNEKNLAIFHFLCVLLKEKKCNISYTNNANGKKTQNTNATEIVLLSDDEYIEKETLRILFPNAKQCISLKGIPSSISMDSDLLMQFHLIDVAELFKAKQLRVASQRASRVLMSALKKKKGNNFPIHGSSLNVTEISKNIEIRTPKESLIREDSAYVVVGGLTGLGWLIVKYLSKRKAKKIISLSRRSLSSEIEKRIHNIKNLYGVEIIHKEVDITNLNNLTKVIRSVQQQMPNVPIRGVLQGAAVINDNTVPKMTQEKFELPITVKVLGTWNLHLVTKHMELDIFTMHSSVASVFGNYSQTNYAAANAFLDSFAYYRRSLGLPAQVINWGALDVGMGSDPMLRDIFFHKGISLLSAGQICNSLTQMFLSEQIQGIFVDFDIKRFLSANNLKWKASKYAGLISVEEESVPKAISERETTYDSGGNMVNLIKQISAQVLMIDVSEIDDTHTLAQFGVDSQNSIEIINTIYSITKVRIPILLLLSGDFSVQELGNFLSDKMSNNNSNELPSDRHNSESTSMVKRYLENVQLQQPFTVFSFSISPSVNNPEFWRMVMQLFARLNPTLRANVTEVNDQTDSSENVTDVEDFIIPFEHVQTRASLHTKITENRETPFSVIYDDKANKANLHMSCSRTYFDAFCGKIIQKDLQKIATYVIARNPVPAWLDKGHVDFLSTYSSKLHRVAEKSKNYWKHRLLLCKTSASLKSKFPLLEPKQTEGKISLPLTDVYHLKELASSNGWTMFNILSSAFQIALHKITYAERVPLLTEVDLRSQIWECQEQILSCVNYVPLVSPNFFQPGVTIHEIINENEQVVKDATLHGLYTFADIMELDEFDSKLHKTHSFLFDTTDVADQQYINLTSTQIEKNSTFETLLYAVHNTTEQTLVLEFHFCPERVFSSTASILTAFVLDFIQTLSEKHTKTLKQLHLQPTLENHLASSPKARFLLVKDNGNRKPVVLELKQGFPPVISWGPDPGKQTKLTEIMEVKTFQDNGRSGLRLQCLGKKDITFESSEERECQAWVTFLRQQLPSAPLKTKEFEDNENYIQSTEKDVENTYL